MSATELERAEYAVALAEQAATDAEKASTLAVEKAEECGRSLEELREEIRLAAGSSDEKNLRKLIVERDVKAELPPVLEEKVEEANRAVLEAGQALSVARATLQAAESRRRDAEHIQARENLQSLIHTFAESQEVKKCLANVRFPGEGEHDLWHFLRLDNRDLMTPDEKIAESQRADEEYSAQWEAKRKAEEEKDRRWEKKWAKEKRERNASVPGVEVVALPGRPRTDENGVVIRDLSDDEMRYRIAHELEKQDEEAYRNLEGEDFK